MKLYRLISIAEAKDIQVHNGFREAENTLEVKQFWLSRQTYERYLTATRIRQFQPPYTHLVEVDLAEEAFISDRTQELDGYEAVVIDMDELPYFNSIITFQVLNLK